MSFNKESDFEKALIDSLLNNGWNEVLKNKSEQELINNWADIIYKNNCEIDTLNHQPLTSTEMQQILANINGLKTPLLLNSFINDKSTQILRDNPNDNLHFGKTVSLKLFDRDEIAAGKNRYQIAEQPRFEANIVKHNDRRGDLMLLINGMPVIHIELKRSGIPVGEACNQIIKYSHEHIFSGIFSLVQVFVAMNPEEMLYFANPGNDGVFNPDYFFHWADINNIKVNDWKLIATEFLSIPPAHELIGRYTVPDKCDHTLKVMRSYQIWACRKIVDKVLNTNWGESDNKGGYIWHTTGSGKTLTSFKCSQIIAQTKKADKVIFLVDRKDLANQSLIDYRGFQTSDINVNDTSDTYDLLQKLKSDNPNDTLIVTSIQKMSNIDGVNFGSKNEVSLINCKRIVIIIDECHRDTFGDMLWTIKSTFTRAIFFGFSGTPIFKENAKKDNTTADVFGGELHRYTIADGINDKNVLGFDPYMIQTYSEKDERTVVALEKAKAKSIEEAMGDPKKRKVFNYYMNIVPMEMKDPNNKDSVKGIEDFLPSSQYFYPDDDGNDTMEHHTTVVKSILDNWVIKSQNSKFHALLGTTSIVEAIDYYRLFKKYSPNLRVTALFDFSEDNKDGGIYKQEAIIEILDDYNKMFGTDFSMTNYDKFKKDIALRLAHKDYYFGIENNAAKQINLVIVVNQLLTGFDSKWLNTLYLDKLLWSESIIQAFSRTNRLFGYDKPYGTIMYYRYPFTMERNIKSSFKQYSGESRPLYFVNKLKDNLDAMNLLYQQISNLFKDEGIDNFEKLPDDDAAKKKFSLLFKELFAVLESAKIQSFNWKKSIYKFVENGTQIEVISKLNEITYQTLLMRYKELARTGSTKVVEQPFEIDSTIIEIHTEQINSDYMNKNFKKYIHDLQLYGKDNEVVVVALENLHKTFSSLSQEQQKFANLVIHDIEAGILKIDNQHSFMDYVIDYETKAKNDKIHRFAIVLGLDEGMLRKFSNLNINEDNINDYNRFDKLRDTVDFNKARSYLEGVLKTKLTPPNVVVKVDSLLRTFILSDGKDVEI